jgi:chromosome segregation ATPase
MATFREQAEPFFDQVCNAIETKSAELLNTEAQLIQRKAELDAREKALSNREAAINARDAEASKSLEERFRERERVVSNREAAVGEVRTLAAKRLQEIKTLEQNIVDLNTKVAEATNKARAAEDRMKKLVAGLDILKEVQEQA